jgi:hypothetical protein
MIAFTPIKRGRGRPMGGKNAMPSSPMMVRIGGAATSAASVHRCGISEGYQALSIHIPGEGWVRWSALEAQFSEAHRQWRIRKAMAGVFIFDTWEWRNVQMLEGRDRQARNAQAYRKDDPTFESATELGLLRPAYQLTSADVKREL